VGTGSGKRAATGKRARPTIRGQVLVLRAKKKTGARGEKGFQKTKGARIQGKQTLLWGCGSFEKDKGGRTKRGRYSNRNHLGHRNSNSRTTEKKPKDKRAPNMEKGGTNRGPVANYKGHPGKK